MRAYRLLQNDNIIITSKDKKFIEHFAMMIKPFSKNIKIEEIELDY